MPNDLFPPELISGSVQNQEELNAALLKYSNLSKSLITIGTHRVETRKWYEDNWQRLYKYLDKDFASKFQLESEHEARAWEFHVASVLHDQGFALQEKTWDMGPDFCVVTNDGKKIWIEAVSCTSGVIDPVPPKPNLTEGEVYIGGGSIEDLNRPRVLRILNAIGTKYEKFKKYVVDSKSGVSENDCLIIAVSGANIEFASRSDVLLKRAVFGVGPDVYRKDLTTGELIGPFYTPTPDIIKKAKSGDETMPTSFMEMDDFSNISAVIYCGHHAYNCERNGHKIGEDFLFAYHMNAKNPILDGLFKFGRGIRKSLDSTIIDKNQS
ncbi:MAG TPA: hypothetical protein VLK22_02575 [Candidatus Udaeobacter sp.]|nr:hypothetical protein [Candidatus Udaeobacter sp.]